jgi:hypothetical protein
LFLKKKIDLKGKFLTVLIDLKTIGLVVKLIWCDDSNENKALFDACQSKGYNIKFEFSGPWTPQHNVKVERMFQNFFGRIRTMLHNAGDNDQLRSEAYVECAMKVTFLSNDASIKNKEASHDELYLAATQSYQQDWNLLVKLAMLKVKPISKFSWKIKEKSACLFGILYIIQMMFTECYILTPKVSSSFATLFGWMRHIMIGLKGKVLTRKKMIIMMMSLQIRISRMIS